MAIESLDLSEVELDQGSSDYKIITTGNDPAASITPTRASVGTSLTQLGNPDGYDMSSASHIRLFFDVKVDTPDENLKLYIEPVAASPGNPITLAGPDSDSSYFPPFIPVVQAVEGAIEVADGALIFQNPTVGSAPTIVRGSLTLPRDAQAIRFRAKVPTGGGTSGIALAAQSVLQRSA
jgi:hypothetical protein